MTSSQILSCKGASLSTEENMSQEEALERIRRRRRQETPDPIKSSGGGEVTDLWETSNRWFYIGFIPLILSVLVGIKVGTEEFGGFWPALLTSLPIFSLGLLIIAIGSIAAAYAKTYGRGR